MFPGVRSENGLCMRINPRNRQAPLWKGGEFYDNLKIGDTCLVTRGKDKGKRCIVLYKAGHTIKYDHRIGIVVVKPEDYGNLFESSTLTYRYFKLFSHTELRKTLF